MLRDKRFNEIPCNARSGGVGAGVLAVFLLGISPLAEAQLLIPGKGFALETGASGTMTATAGEVISGNASIKGVSTKADGTHLYLRTDTAILRLVANQSYRISTRYKILAASSGAFQVSVYSPTAAAAGRFLPAAIITGAAGDTGTATLQVTLGPYDDYVGNWSIRGTGAIAVDDIEISDASGRVIAVERGEGPLIDAGPLNFQVLDAKTFAPPAAAPGRLVGIRSVAVQDLDGDGSAEVVVTLTTHPDQVPMPPMIISTTPKLTLDTQRIFPAGISTVKHSPLTLFPDINGDGKQDIVFADAGLDVPPWTGSRILVGLNQGDGTYRDVSSHIPDQLATTRNYGLAAADLDGDGRAEILLPDEIGDHQAVLRWDGSTFQVDPRWIDRRVWQPPTSLRTHLEVAFADLDRDGKQDLVVSANIAQPNWRVLFGNGSGPFTTPVVTLPDGPFGYTPNEQRNAAPMTQGGAIGPFTVADFNNDGAPDIFALEEQAVHVQPGAITDTKVPNYATLLRDGGDYRGEIALQVLMNAGARRFRDHSSASSTTNLGWRIYHSLMVVDLTNDGFLDVVGIYQTKRYGSDPSGLLSSTLFLNDGSGGFTVVDSSDIGPAATTNPTRNGRFGLGSFVPTLVTPDRIEGVILDITRDGFLSCYRVAANGSISR